MLALCAPRTQRLNLYPSLPRYKNRHHQPESVCKIIPILRSLSAQPEKVSRNLQQNTPGSPEHFAPIAKPGRDAGGL